MSVFRILSVNENDGQSDVITARLTKYGFHNRTIDISFDADSKMTVSINGDAGYGRAEFMYVDIDSLIEYLQEAKQFISEEQLVRKLCGVK